MSILSSGGGIVPGLNSCTKALTDNAIDGGRGETGNFQGVALSERFRLL